MYHYIRIQKWEDESPDPQEIIIMKIELGWVELDFKGHLMAC